MGEYMDISTNYIEPFSGADWNRQTYRMHREDLVYGRLSIDAHVRQLHDTFSLEKVSADLLPDVTRSVFRDQDLTVFHEIWRVEEDERSELLYRQLRAEHARANLSEAEGREDRVFILLDRSRPFSQFISNSDFTCAFLEFFRGIDLRDLEEMTPDGGNYLVSVYALAYELSLTHGTDTIVELPEPRLGHAHYLCAENTV